MQTRWEIAPVDDAIVAHLQEVLGIDAVLARLLALRGVTTYDEAYRFFRPQWTHLHDPFLMADMDRAVARLRRAVAGGEHILIYGDYDVDGTTATALLFDFLHRLAPGRVHYYIPHRQHEGYGLSMAGIEYALAKEVSLVVTVDCGIKAGEVMREGVARGLDFIVCDHHLPPAELPPAVAVLDPKRPDCRYPYDELSGCAIAFKLIQAWHQQEGHPVEELAPCLDLVALSIAADIVPITDENRVLAALGLARLNEAPRPGLRMLIRHSGRGWPLRISDIVFGLAPAINAAGRLEHAELAVRLMLAADKGVAEAYARKLGVLNEQRKQLDQMLYTQAMAEAQHLPEAPAWVLYQPDWHKGLLGIGAARLVEHLHRPVILLAQKDDGLLAGSGRSAAGVNLYEALKECAPLLDKFGGHAHAAGLVLPKAHLERFRAAFAEAVRRQLDGREAVPVRRIEAELPLSAITPKFWRILQQFAPFGPGNPNPLFAARQVRQTGMARRLRGDHLRLHLAQDDMAPVPAIAFNQGHHFEAVTAGQPFDICYKIEPDRFEKGKRWRIQVREFRF